MHVSVPGMYQNPAPYREQTLTYSTALAFTGRSAACAPPMASKPAAEPRTRLLTIFILKTSKLLSSEGSGPARVFPLQGWLPKNRSVVSRLATPRETRDFERTN